MPRKNIIRTEVNPYHINARSNNQDWFIPSMDLCYYIFIEVINKTREKYRFQFHHFVLMNNHFHMIVSTPDANIDRGMRYFMTEVSRRIARSSNRINKIFGQRYHWTLIEDSVQYAHAVKYLYQNPLEAKIETRIELYRYSSLTRTQNAFSENKNGFNEFLPTKLDELLDWINEPYPAHIKECIKQAMKKPIFKLSKSRNNNQKVDLKKYLKNSS
jgi:putative transposase